MKSERKTDGGIPELLAPAGTLEAAITAYKYGADAVYAGLGRFNAREMGKNFTFEEMSKLSAFAKQNKKKFYLTLNTLVKEQEITDLVDFISKVKAIEPDAFILQDIGVANIMKKYFPEIELHGSTQMGFHNSAGLSVADRMGFKRVILERQVSLEEIRLMLKSTPLEVEVFIHGALCCGLSGHCLFSSWIGGWSGNRGRCKQPCRRRYHGSVEGEKKSGFFFSPQDLYSLDIIGELKRMGIASLKIEGRLKQPDYIKNVVTAYRMVLDAEPDQERGILGEARNILSGSYGRKWSHGFFFEKETAELLQFDSVGVSGQLIGKVARVKPTGFEVSLSRRLHLGDRIRIQPQSGEEGPAVTVTRLSMERRTVNIGKQGERVFIHCGKEVPSGGLVYKIGESRKDDLPSIDKLPEYIAPAGVRIGVRVDAKGMSAHVKGLEEDINITWDEVPEPAQNRPLEAPTLVELFGATRNKALRADDVDVDITGEWFIPASLLKKRRREFWELVETQYSIPDSKADIAAAFPEKIELSESRLSDGPLLVRFFPDGPAADRSGTKEFSGFKVVECMTLDNFSVISEKKRNRKDEIEIILPHFCPEKELEKLKAGVDSCVQSGIRRFRITSLYQFSLFDKKEGLLLTAAYPLPIANSFAAAEAAGLGARRFQGWIELEKDALLMLQEHAPLQAEQFIHGKPFLLATRAPVMVEGPINDSRGGQFFVKRTEAFGIQYIYPDKTLDIPPLPGFDIYWEAPRKNPADKGETSTFNFEQTWV